MKDFKELNKHRRDYVYGLLLEEDMLDHPILQFGKWFEEAVAYDIDLPDAMSLATCVNGQPDSRIVALRGFSKEGFIFYTNYNSKKGKDIEINPKASLLFHWKGMDRQIRIHGVISKIDPELSNQYFKTRSKKSRFAQICSHQSSIISSREELDKKFEKVKSQNNLDRPQYWGGYILQPFYFEFWQGRDNRLHDRLDYIQKKDSWVIRRLQP